MAWEDLTPYQQEDLLNSQALYDPNSGFGSLVPGAVASVDPYSGGLVYISPSAANGGIYVEPTPSDLWVKIGDRQWVLRSSLTSSPPTGGTTTTSTGTVAPTGGDTSGATAPVYQTVGAGSNAAAGGETDWSGYLPYIAIGLLAASVLLKGGSRA